MNISPAPIAIGQLSDIHTPNNRSIWYMHLKFMTVVTKIFLKTDDLCHTSERIMRLRTNKVLKFFVLLLFSLEFMAPAILIDIAGTENNQDKVQLVDGAHRQNVLFSIFSEEITENESGREGQKDTILFEDFGFAFDFLQVLASEPVAYKHSSLISDQFDTQPALFKLNCTFLI